MNEQDRNEELDEELEETGFLFNTIIRFHPYGCLGTCPLCWLLEHP